MSLPEKPQRIGSLELHLDERIQHSVWTVQRVGWVLMGAFLLAAVLGLFGDGPLSRASAEGGGLKLEYVRTARVSFPITLDVHGTSDGQGVFQLWFERSLFEKSKVEHVMPEPERVEFSSERVTYIFRTTAPGPVHVVLELKPERAGKVHAQLGVVGGGEVRFEQLVFP
ncbi:hypothetical protein F0U61_07570 [Archangium violaceum]|uniref:hypothetical protein n=1 Tax=Archangium violaceum TaxID=83451 RepID=UPI002B2979B1|nr:hypothetical protein F0U61_07570 [Archangium violaceum]